MLTMEMSTITGPVLFQVIIATVGAGGQGTAKRVVCGILHQLFPRPDTALTRNPAISTSVVSIFAKLTGQPCTREER